MSDAVPLRVEFFGLPGSGKTTIARELLAALGGAGADMVYGPAAIRDGAPAAARLPARLALVARDLRGDDMRHVARLAALPQATARDRAKAVFNLATVLALDRRLDRDGAGAVIDQGVLQAVWSAGLRARAAEVPRCLHALLWRTAGTARLHVCVETPLPLCTDRLATRAGRHSRMQREGLLGDGETWRRGELLRAGILEVLAAAYRQRGVPARLVFVDGTRDPAETAAFLARGLGVRTAARGAEPPLIAGDRA